jgi:hypothetical protein
MTLSSKLFSLFPALHISLILGAIYYFVASTTPLSFLLVFVSIYVFPVLCHSILRTITPIEEGVTDIFAKNFSPWWASHQIQSLFIAIPRLESLLILIPGLYSFWLRCWGSKIGKGVYWTPGVANYDRDLLVIGDGAIFGERAVTVAHVITPKGGKGLLMVAKIKVGIKCFVGAGAGLGPGVKMDDGTFVKAESRIFPNNHVTKDGVIDPRKKD